MNFKFVKPSDLNFFILIVKNSLLKDRKTIFILSSIVISLFCSCIFETLADNRFSKLSLALEKNDKSNPILDYLGFYSLHLLFGWMHNHLFCTNIHYLKSVIYKYLIQRYLDCNSKSISSVGTGKLCSIINKQVDSLIFLLKNVLLKLFYTLSYVYLFFIFLYKNTELETNTKLVFVGIFAISLLYIFTTCFIAYRYKKKLIDTEHSNSHALLDIIKNMTIIKVFNNKFFEISKFNKLMSTQISLGYTFYTFECLFMVGFKILLLSALLIPLQLVRFGVLDFHVIYSFFTNFGFFKRRINELKDCTYTVFDLFIDTLAHSTINTMPSNNINVINSENLISKTPSLVFNNLGISLDEKLIFDHFSYIIPFGSKVAITGINGAGKSTIIKSILGMIEYNGEILINDKEIKRIREDSLHNAFSYVPQEPHLFNITVMDNLKYGNNISDTEIIKKCIDCGVHKIFKSLENGYYTIVGENSKNISGGQAQIINFMRAVIKDSPIFLLDEPTSNLDHKTSNFIISTIFNILKNRTVIFSTHNPHHLVNFDIILNINENKIRVYDGYKDFISDPEYENKL